ncbi:MAG: pesticidal protein Cry15Aa [Herpetosiphonaceae bacterium]|nr:MAG: pesticidal protein Cry15Aa [Herpetosiphonaceae bacterium]
MQLIKKYGNRKLYHTNEKRYITLEGIAGLIREGHDVRVVDNVTGEDITVPTLSQILLQSKGRRGSMLPIPLLADLIQAGGDTIQNLRRSVLSSLGGRALVDTEIRLRLQHLLDEGRISEEECRRIGRLLLHEAEREDAESLPLPSRSDVERLKQQVEMLAAAIDQLLPQEKRP